MNYPLVSVIIPNYNRESLIAETLDSILKQSYSHWECIVVDDGSTDDSETVVNLYHSKDNRITFHKRPEHKPKGANACRNYGLELSKGKYINWFDSDDLMGENKLLKQVQALETTKYSFSICQSFVFENCIDNIIGLKSEKIYSENPFEDFISKKIVIPVQAPIFNRAFLLKYNYNFDETLQAGQEWYFLAKILYYNPKFHAINEPLDYIRSHVHNISNHNTNDKYWYYFLARLKLHKDLKHKLKDESILILNIFYLFFFKQFVRTRNFTKAWFVWRKCLINVKQLSIKEHFFLISGLLIYILFNKGDGIISKVSLYNK